MERERNRPPSRVPIFVFLLCAVMVRFASVFFPAWRAKAMYPVTVIGVVVAARHTWLWVRWMRRRREEEAHDGE